MKRRWRVLLAAGALALTGVLAPILYIEGGCRGPAATADPYRPLLAPAERRPEARTYLTYPEWHIVYGAEAFARHLAAGRPFSSFPYWEQIGSFWRSYCAVNRVTAGSPAAGDAKVMIYTIGVSYSVELAVKAVYERTIGRFAEWAGGWRSADDRYAAGVQADYGRFMHETPWYRFPFGRALAGLWRIRDPDHAFRHAERRLALSAEYGVKAGYAKAIDAATGATLGRDELTLSFVARAAPEAIRAVDPRLRPVRTLAHGLTVVEAPRYQQFNDLLAELAAANVTLVEIAGNDDVFATVVLPARAPAPGPVLLSMPLERPGWRRVGVTVKVPAVNALLRQARSVGGEVEHVYDY